MCEAPRLFMAINGSSVRRLDYHLADLEFHQRRPALERAHRRVDGQESPEADGNPSEDPASTVPAEHVERGPAVRPLNRAGHFQSDRQRCSMEGRRQSATIYAQIENLCKTKLSPSSLSSSPSLRAPWFLVRLPSRAFTTLLPNPRLPRRPRPP